MAKIAEDLTLEFKAKLNVDRSTAEACLKIVELYVNNNGVNVVVERFENGEFKFYYESIETSNGRCRFDGKETRA